MKKIRILNNITTSFIDYPDNESMSLCVIMMGCTHGCKGCQNPYFQNPNYDNGTKEVSVEDLVEELRTNCLKNHTKKVVLSGGDPLATYNIDFTKELLNNSGNEFDYCIYTGHEIEYVKENNVVGFEFVKCGKFEIENYRPSLKDDDKMIFASPNQKLYDSEYNLLSKDGVYEFNNL